MRPPNTTSSDREMTSTAVIASVSVVSVILATITITILIFCLYRRRKQAGNKPKADGGRSGKAHGSSTMRSDKSDDHPYENPSLPRKLNANLKSSKPADGQNSDPYVTLKGQSLPHQYQWLGNKAQPPDESEYDELMASTEGSTSGYYFKLEPGSRGNTGLRPGVDPTSTTTDPDEAYDLVEVGNMVGKNVNSNRNPETISKDTGDDEDPYYFKLGGSKRGSSTAPASLHLTQQPDGKPPTTETAGNKVNRKPPIAAKPNLATQTKGSVEESADYDKLDRSAFRKQDSEDVNANEYNKLLPRLAVSNNTCSDLPSDGYLKVTLGNGRHCGDDNGDESLMEANDYNKLDRGVEKEIDSLAVADK
ncbi:uncharacterized protein LOC121408584 isoform X2 [Lytechinus variegatus]|uniref:uncharacterized protein LOC121408584 isoform X2 n=1 Tax=Lytechinus variegatus TaxID=7654 RepID=UPI001BB1952E|nr:uncharacterized protein LOC121408584 isoform X2 [Lytechinus variegatus]